jgi:broad specificity phosphatase PhoE
MKIALIRHGQPDIELKGKIRHTEFKQWLVEYDCAHVEEKSPPPASLRKDAESYGLFICSDLKRSISSFNLLNINKSLVIDPLFRECELPCWNRGDFSCRADFLVVVYRIMWLLGASANCESKSAALDRAKYCADKLVLLAKTHSSVAFVGHGFLNRFIASSLLDRGWLGPRRPGRGHWSHDVYELS